MSAFSEVTPGGCSSKMKLRANFVAFRRSPPRGFSLAELVLSLAVLLILTTIAVPMVLRSLQNYQLNSYASQLAGMLKFTKFEAIRQNTPVSCQIQQQGNSWLIWVDSNGDGLPNGAEPQMFIAGSFSMLSSGSVPSPAPIQAALGSYGGSLPWMVLSGSNTSVTYDQRGVLSFAGGATVYALYIGNPNDASSGYRAVITLPSGAVQVWASSASGSWQRLS
jgi:prepilin-type N-terminal cleavage/methylation domain-containing protein